MTPGKQILSLIAASSLIAVASCNEASDAPTSSTAPAEASAPHATTTPSQSDAPTESTPAGSQETANPAEPENIASPFADLPAPYNEADYDRGRRQFATCRSCHLIKEGAPHRVGPNLYGMFGRTAGTIEDFRYSKALEEAGFEWTPEKLDAWLANPKEFLPGNRMTFPGIAKPDQRRNLIAYLLVETANTEE